MIINIIIILSQLKSTITSSMLWHWNRAIIVAFSSCIYTWFVLQSVIFTTTTHGLSLLAFVFILIVVDLTTHLNHINFFDLLLLLRGLMWGQLLLQAFIRRILLWYLFVFLRYQALMQWAWVYARNGPVTEVWRRIRAAVFVSLILMMLIKLTVRWRLVTVGTAALNLRALLMRQHMQLLILILLIYKGHLIGRFYLRCRESIIRFCQLQKAVPTDLSPVWCLY